MIIHGINIHKTADTDRETTKTSGCETRGPITCGNQWQKSSSDDDRRIYKNKCYDQSETIRISKKMVNINEASKNSIHLHSWIDYLKYELSIKFLHTNILELALLIHTEESLFQ